MYLNTLDKYIFCFTSVKLRMWLNTFKFVHYFPCVVSDRVSFTPVEIDKNFLLTLPSRTSSCQRRSRESLSSTTREEKERGPGNEVG